MKLRTVSMALGLAALATGATVPLVLAQEKGGRRAGTRPGGDGPAEGQRFEIKAGGLRRTGLLFLPRNERRKKPPLVAFPKQGEDVKKLAKGLKNVDLRVISKIEREKPPLLIGFHGHGADGAKFARQTGFSDAWPEAILFFPDGLNAPGGEDPDGTEPGWERNPGDQDDRDLALFDAIVKKAVATYDADPRRVYVAGFSNGGRLIYLLWSLRGDKIRAIAASASECINHKLNKTLSPKPAAVIHGRADDRVPFKTGIEDINAVLQANRSTENMTRWPQGTLRKRYYAIGKGGAGTMVITHPGPHTWPDFATPEVVAFFKEHE